MLYILIYIMRVRVLACVTFSGATYNIILFLYYNKKKEYKYLLDVILRKCMFTNLLRGPFLLLPKHYIFAKIMTFRILCSV